MSSVLKVALASCTFARCTSWSCVSSCASSSACLGSGCASCCTRAVRRREFGLYKSSASPASRAQGAYPHCARSGVPCPNLPPSFAEAHALRELALASLRMATRTSHNMRPRARPAGVAQLRLSVGVGAAWPVRGAIVAGCRKAEVKIVAPNSVVDMVARPSNVVAMSTLSFSRS